MSKKVFISCLLLEVGNGCLETHEIKHVGHKEEGGWGGGKEMCQLILRQRL